MAGTNSGRGSGSRKKLVDQFKDICPPHKVKDLESLIRACNGEEERISQRIQEWWDEPHVPEEAQWEAVDKKGKKKPHSPEPDQNSGPQQENKARGGGRGRARGGGGGGRGRTEGRGKTEGRGRADGRSRGRARGGRGRDGRGPKDSKQQNGDMANTEVPDVAEELPPGIPTPLEPSPPQGLQGPWGHQSVQPVPVTPLEQNVPSMPPPPVTLSEPKPELNAKPAVARPAGNVWATKGSAHLIKAETAPKPPPPKPVRKDVSIQDTTSALESGLPASVNGANVNAAGWKPSVETTQLDSLPMSQTSVKEPVVTPQKPSATTTKNVPNMGHWDTTKTDSDETKNLDFGFGSFGNSEDGTPSVGETTMSSSTQAVDNKEHQATVQTAASPARPPPGLSIGSAPPLPANAVLVSDLESKLESASLGPKPVETVVPSQPEPPKDTPGPPPGVGGPVHILPQVGGMNQNYNSPYGMGMYNYNAAGNAFVAGMHGAPVLPGGVPPKGGIAGQNAGSAPPHMMGQGGLYGAPSTSAGASASAPSDGNNAATPGTGTPMPPGMPNMGYPNPALFYGQQPYQMGQPHGGYGYGYGAQFGAAVQGGFGYQQGMMGQSGGYPYDDQQQQGNSGGYQKNNSGGYRGRGGGNQYQNNYNPQGGYGGPPYGMGYDHFNQRGGYGPNPYGMQQGSGSFGPGGFQGGVDDDQYGKSGRKGSKNFQFQQHSQNLGGGQQQSFNRQVDDSNMNSWSNQQAGGGGWGGGGPSF